MMGWQDGGVDAGMGRVMRAVYMKLLLEDTIVEKGRTVQRRVKENMILATVTRTAMDNEENGGERTETISGATRNGRIASKKRRHSAGFDIHESKNIINFNVIFS
jgi:hypothetical protein